MGISFQSISNGLMLYPIYTKNLSQTKCISVFHKYKLEILIGIPQQCNK